MTDEKTGVCPVHGPACSWGFACPAMDDVKWCTDCGQGHHCGGGQPGQVVMAREAASRKERERIVKRLDFICADNVVPEVLYELMRELGWPLKGT